MEHHQLQNLRKAARAGLSWANDAATWHAGIDALAKAAQRPGEPFETAYARVVAEDADARAMLKMHTAAADQAQAERKGGRPRQYDPGTIQRGKIEKALSDSAMEIARAQGISYEMAFSRALDTPAGADLYKRLRTLESS